MEWDMEKRLKLAKRIRDLSLEIQAGECRKPGTFHDMVERTIGRIMERLEPLGFERANRDWTHLEEDKGMVLNLYQDSPTHLWFETAQSKIVKIRKEHAEKLLVLGIP